VAASPFLHMIIHQQKTQVKPGIGRPQLLPEPACKALVHGQTPKPWPAPDAMLFGTNDRPCVESSKLHLLLQGTSQSLPLTLLWLHCSTAVLLSSETQCICNIEAPSYKQQRGRTRSCFQHVAFTSDRLDQQQQLQWQVHHRQQALGAAALQCSRCNSISHSSCCHAATQAAAGTVLSCQQQQQPRL
jgi:hypothetical protein